MNKLTSNIFSVIGFVATAFLLFTSYTDRVENQNAQANEEDKTTLKSEYNLPQVVKSIPLAKIPSFAGEEMPINIDTKERLDRELTVNSYWHSSTLLNIKNAKKYFPIIERILAENGVPDDFKYLAVAESSLRNVTSGAGARGFWQFRTLAAKEMGLEVNSEVDERYHLEKSTEAAANYLKKLKERFGSWTNAAAAYNVGPTNYSKSLRDQGHDSFYDLNLNPETNRYVFRLIAIKEIMKDPSAFGFYIEPEDEYDSIEDVYEVEVNESVPNWGEFARKYGISYRLLKYYNPWLKDDKLTVKKNIYFIKIPKQ